VGSASEDLQLPSGLIIPPGVDPDDLDTIVLQPQKNAVINYVCPMCGHRIKSEYAGMVEPCCTGPHPSLDEHEMIPMIRVDS